MADDQNKSEKCTNPDHDQVFNEQSTDKSESEQNDVVVVSKNEEGETDLKELTRVDPDLASLIINAGNKKSVDSKILQKAVEMVKAFLRQDKEKNVDALLRFKHFISFFVKCLQNNSNNSSLQFNLAWIFEAILTYGCFSHVEALLDQETVTIPLFIKLLQSPDRTIYEKVALVLTYLVQRQSSRTQLVSIASSIFVPLAKLLKSKNPPEQFIKYSAQIVCDMLNYKTALRKFIINQDTQETVHGLETINLTNSDAVIIDSDEVEDYMPSSRIVKQAIPVISILLDCHDDLIRLSMLQCLTIATAVLDNIRPLIDNDCSSKLASFFSYSDESLVAGAIIATGSIAASSSWQLLAFLKSLKGTDGLKHYWKAFKMDLKASQKLSQAIRVFMGGVADVIHYNLENEGINAVIGCGMVESLIQCFNGKEIPQEWQNASILTLSCMIHQLPIEKRNVVTAILPTIIELLRTCVTSSITTKCTNTLIKLIEGSTERRDWAIELGAIPALLDVFEKLSPEDFQGQSCVLNCLDLMLEVKPRASVQHFANVPLALRNFLADMPVALESNVALAFNVIAQLASYETTSSLEMIIEAKLIPIVISFLSYSHAKIQSSTIDVVFYMCLRGTDEQRKKFLKEGVLGKLDKLLEAIDDCTRKRALQVLLIFLFRKRLTSTMEKQTLKKFGSLVEKELSTNVLDNYATAKMVLQKIRELK